MSHFSTLVILNKDQAREPESSVSELLDPFDENKEMDDYETTCSCAGVKARLDASKQATQTLGITWDQLRTKFWEKYPSDADLKGATRDELWMKHTGKLRRAEKAIEKAHPLYKKTDPDCEDCKGTGHRMTTYNPDSKWDWYQIGGRWTGALTGYDPGKDPANQEQCSLCGGTGKRTDAIALAHPPLQKSCNGCDGKGIRVKWPTQWESYEHDICPIRKIRADFFPYAIVTPDGEWHERGKMSWFGISLDEMEENEWRNYFLQIRKQYRNHIAVIVDCHI
jgi:hypothetical protein